MVKLGVFAAEILQDDIPVQEHDDSNAKDTKNSLTKYVEIKEDQQYAIKVVIGEAFTLGQFDALYVKVEIDGKHVGGKAFQRAYFENGHEVTKVIKDFDGKVEGRNVVRQLRFEETTTSKLGEMYLASC